MLLCVLAGSVLIAFFISNFLQKQISMPIISLADTARAVSEQKDYSVRAEKHTGDELGFVIDAFNSMLEQIQASHATSLARARKVPARGRHGARPHLDRGRGHRISRGSTKVLAQLRGSADVQRRWARAGSRNLLADDRDTCLATIAESYRLKRYFRLECRIRRADGVYRWLLYQGAPRFQGGEFAGFIGSCVDITDSKEAEAAVRLSELQLRLVTDHASVFICQIDREHRLTFVNRAYALRFGLTPQDIVGRPLLDFIGRDAYLAIRDRLDAAMNGARQEFETELSYATLGRRWIHAVYEPLKGADGSVRAIVCVLSDVTERQRAAKDLERARDEAVKASRAKDEFLAALSTSFGPRLTPCCSSPRTRAPTRISRRR